MVTKIDSLDKRLVEILQKNARLTNGNLAGQLGVSSSSLTRFLSGHRKAWAEANRVRRAAGLSALRAP